MSWHEPKETRRIDHNAFLSTLILCWETIRLSYRTRGCDLFHIEATIVHNGSVD